MTRDLSLLGLYLLTRPWYENCESTAPTPSQRRVLLQDYSSVPPGTSTVVFHRSLDSFNITWPTHARCLFGDLASRCTSDFPVTVTCFIHIHIYTNIHRYTHTCTRTRICTRIRTHTRTHTHIRNMTSFHRFIRIPNPKRAMFPPFGPKPIPDYYLWVVAEISRYWANGSGGASSYGMESIR